jgi:5'-nucleotidase
LTYSRVTLTYDFQLRGVSEHLSEIVTPDCAGVDPDVDMERLLEPYRFELAAALDGPIAQATGMFARGDNIERLGEVPLGNLIADAMRIHYDARIGFVNGGGIRASLPSSYAPADLTLHRPSDGYAEGPPWDLVIGDVYTVLPFGNTVVTRTVTGSQVWEMAEHSIEALPAPRGWFGQISGFQMLFDSSRPVGARVVSLTLDDGTAIQPDDSSYTLATSDFVNAGGDGYSMLQGGDGIYRDKLAEVVLVHIHDLDIIEPLIHGRIIDLANP